MKNIMSERKKVSEIPRCIYRELRLFFSNSLGPMRFDERCFGFEPSENLVLAFYRQLTLLLKPMLSYNASEEVQQKFMKCLSGRSDERFISNKTYSLAIDYHRWMHSLEWDARVYHRIPRWSKFGISFDLVNPIRDRFWRQPMTVTEFKSTSTGTGSLFSNTSNHTDKPFVCGWNSAESWREKQVRRAYLTCGLLVCCLLQSREKARG